MPSTPSTIGTINKVAVLGGGSWGTTLASHLAGRGLDCTLWVREAEVEASIRERRVNELYLQGIELDQALAVTTDFAGALSGVDMVVSSVPSHFIKGVFTEAAEFVPPEAIIVNTSKGIVVETGQRGSEIFSEFDFDIKRFVVLSGPSFAAEVARGLPCAVVAASTNARSAGAVQEAFSTPGFRVYTNDDITGVELGGALKNVMAVASGISDGLKLGANARAALITRGLSEMAALGQRMGAKRETFFGLAGLGDLVLTATGALSRNYTLGLSIGGGQSLSEALSGKKTVAEGLKTSLAVSELSRKLAVVMPITEAVANVLHHGKDPATAVMELMTRELKPE